MEDSLKQVIMILFIVLMCSCKSEKVPVRDFLDIYSYASSETTTTQIIVSGIDVYQLRGKRAIKKRIRRKNVPVFFCDASLPNNLILSYLNGCDSFPAIITINEDGTLSRGKYYSWKKEQDGEFIADFENTYLAHLYKSFVSEDPLGVDTDILFLDSIACKKPYYFFLASLVKDNESWIFRYRDSLYRYANRNDIRDVYVLTQTPRSSRGDALIALFENKVELGEVKGNEIREISIPFMNVGVQPLLLYDSIVSCSCLEVKIPLTRIDPGSSGEIKVSFKAPKEAGPVSQSIIVYSNSYNQVDEIMITATVE